VVGSIGWDGGWERPHFSDIEDVDSVYRLVSDLREKTELRSNDFSDLRIWRRVGRF